MRKPTLIGSTTNYPSTYKQTPTDSTTNCKQTPTDSTTKYPDVYKQTTTHSTTNDLPSVPSEVSCDVNGPNRPPLLTHSLDRSRALRVSNGHSSDISSPTLSVTPSHSPHANKFHNHEYHVDFVFRETIHQVHNFHDRVLNLSNVNFSNEELNFLGFGLKYSPESNFRMSDAKTLIMDIEYNRRVGEVIPERENTISIMPPPSEDENF